MKRLMLLAFVGVSFQTARADKITMLDGRVEEGVILQQTPTSVLLALEYGTVLYPKQAIKEFTWINEEAGVSKDGAKQTPSRLPTWQRILRSLIAKGWATEVQQIPATVVDQGPLKSVPYQSYQVSKDYELNIYGDPDTPACVEIGVYRKLLDSNDAKSNCIEFIASILPDQTDAAIVRGINRSKDLIQRGGLSLEVTPPSAPDAYGGWWISVYFETELDKARATEAEVKAISVAKRPSNDSKAPKPDDSDTRGWNSDDLSRTRQVASNATSSSGDSGRVYVRGYYRKDGTYVSGHMRRKPARHQRKP